MNPKKIVDNFSPMLTIERGDCDLKESINIPEGFSAKRCNINSMLRKIFGSGSLIKCATFVLSFFLFSYGQLAAQSVKVIKWQELERVLNTPSEKPTIINFWATWCRPCVKELPFFLEAADSMQGQFDMVLVSLDFKSDLEQKVIPFIDRRQIKLPVLLLDETDYNSFIDKVDPQWSGAIPATLMLSPERRTKAFFEKEYHNSLELMIDIRTFIQSQNKQYKK